MEILKDGAKADESEESEESDEESSSDSETSSESQDNAENPRRARQVTWDRSSRLLQLLNSLLQSVALVCDSSLQARATKQSGTSSAGNAWTNESSLQSWHHTSCKAKCVCSTSGCLVEGTGAKLS